MLALLALAVLAPTQRIGLALNVPQGGGADAFIGAMRQQIRLGLDGNALSLKWDEFETQNGKPLDDGLGAATLMGQKVLLTIATIDTVHRRLPADLATTKWDDPKMERRFDKFLETIAPKLRDNVQWVSLGNEVNLYLASHADETAGYLKFLAHERDTLHQLIPNMAVGVTVTDGDGIKAPELVKTLQAGMDVVVFTFYPLNGMQVLPPTDVPQHFRFMTGIAQDRPLLL
ncbi:MAG TPA: hypothetical protein VG944_22330, partial [Fimbriimonas sp.]|nr:hypothetical protein [Fimbriimonas sp.]